MSEERKDGKKADVVYNDAMAYPLLDLDGQFSIGTITRAESLRSKLDSEVKHALHRVSGAGFMYGHACEIMGDVQLLNVQRSFSIEDLEIGSSESVGKVRAKLPINVIPYFKNIGKIGVRLEDLSLQHPVVLRVLGNAERRARVLKRLNNDELLQRVARHICGSANKVRVGALATHSFESLYAVVAGLQLGYVIDMKGMDLSTDKAMEDFVITKVIFDTLSVLKTSYKILDVLFLNMPETRMLNLQDLKSAAMEGRVASILPADGKWSQLTNFKPESKTDVSYQSVIELLVKAAIDFQAKLSSLSLYELELDAVFNAARLASLQDMGLVVDFRDHTLLEMLSRSEVLKKIGSLAPVADSLMSKTNIDLVVSSSEYLRGMSSQVLQKYAEDVYSSLERHDFVELLTRGEFLDDVRLYHVLTGSGQFHFQSVIERARDVTAGAKVYYEMESGYGLKSVIGQKHLSTTINSIINGFANIGPDIDGAVYYALTERNDAALSKLSDYGTLRSKAEVAVIINRLSVEEVRLLALLKCEISFAYEYKEDSGMLSIDTPRFLIRTDLEHNKSVLTALDIIDNTYVTSDCLVALFFSERKDSAKSKKDVIFDVPTGLYQQSLSSLSTNLEIPKALDYKITLKGARTRDNEIISYSIDMIKTIGLSRDPNAELHIINTPNAILLSKSLEASIDLLLSLHDNVSGTKVTKWASFAAAYDVDEIRRLAYQLSAAILSSMHEVPIFKTMRQVAVSELTPQLSVKTKAWQSWSHNLALQSTISMHALMATLRLFGVSKECTERFASAYENSVDFQAYFQREASSSDFYGKSYYAWLYSTDTTDNAGAKF